MKKVLFIVFALFFLAAALLGGTTFWFGLEAQQKYHDILQQASMFGYIHFTNESYNRGFLGSKARTVVEIQGTDGNEGGEEPFRFTLIHDIRHGPLPFWKSPDGKRQLKPVLAIIETGIELGPETKGKLEKILGEFPETASIRNYTTLSIGGNGETQLVIPAFQQRIVKEGKVTVNWKGLSAHTAFTADFKEFTGSLNAPGLEAVGENGNFKMKGVESALDIYKGPSELFLGNTSFDIALLQFSDKENGEAKQFSITGLKMKGSSQASGDTINYSMAMQIERVMNDDTSYGPGGYELELRKIDAASLAKLQQVAQEMQAEFPQHSATQISQMMLAKYTEILPGLMKKSPEIEITRLSLKTGDGGLTGKAKIAFHGTNAEALNNVFLLLSAVTAHAEFTIADRLLQRMLESTNKKEIIAAVQQGKRGDLSEEEIDALAAAKSDKRLEALVKKNILVHEDGNYKASADYRQGQVILNGRPVTLQDLQE